MEQSKQASDTSLVLDGPVLSRGRELYGVEQVGRQYGTVREQCSVSQSVLSNVHSIEPDTTKERAWMD